MYTLELLTQAYAVCRISDPALLPLEIPHDDELYSLTVTRGEVSLVCREQRVPAGTRTEPGWRALKVAGPLDFALTGVLASLANALARAEVSVFAVSTYETDYLLVPARRLDTAIEALQAAGHRVRL